MSINFKLFTKGDEAHLTFIGEVMNAACFMPLASKESLRAYIEVKPAVLDNANVVNYCPEVSEKLSRKEAVVLLDALLKKFNFTGILPDQTPESILERGIFVDGAVISGTMLISILSIVRYLHEEPNIVKTFNKLLLMEGMDTITAFVLVHGLYITGTDVVLCGPNNTNHTVYVGKITKDTLVDAWTEHWNRVEKGKAPWTVDNKIGGTFVMFSLRGNKYINPTILDGLHNTHKNDLQVFLNNVIYPLRDKTLADFNK